MFHKILEIQKQKHEERFG